MTALAVTAMLLCPPLWDHPPTGRGVVLCGLWWHQTKCPYGCPIEFRKRK
jgi:hypothetical protein